MKFIILADGAEVVDANDEIVTFPTRAAAWAACKRISADELSVEEMDED